MEPNGGEKTNGNTSGTNKLNNSTLMKIPRHRPSGVVKIIEALELHTYVFGEHLAKTLGPPELPGSSNSTNMGDLLDKQNIIDPHKKVRV